MINIVSWSGIGIAILEPERYEISGYLDNLCCPYGSVLNEIDGISDIHIYMISQILENK